MAVGRVLIAVVICGLVVASVTGFVLAGAYGAGHGRATDTCCYDVVLKCGLPRRATLPLLLPIKAPELSPALARSIAIEFFGFSEGCTVRSEGTRVVITEGPRCLEFYSVSGMLSIFYDEPITRPKALPTPSRAAEVAEGFLAGLLAKLGKPEGYEVTLAGTGPALVEVTTTPLGEVVSEETLAIGVFFAISLYGVRAWGPGADVSIWVGEDERIVSVELHIIWAKAEGEVHLITPEEAVERLRRGEFYGPALLMPLPKTLVVKHAYLAYYVDDPGVGISGASELLLEPVYCFGIELEDGDIITLAVSATP